jgi:RNA polymerase primary sigma factor
MEASESFPLRQEPILQAADELIPDPFVLALSAVRKLKEHGLPGYLPRVDVMDFVQDAEVVYLPVEQSESVVSLSPKIQQASKRSASKDGYEARKSWLDEIDKDEKEEDLIAKAINSVEPGTSEAAYLNRVLDHRLLSREEELDLAKRIECGDLEAKEKLMTHNMKLVASISRRYHANHLKFIDIFQEGTLGLMRAAEKFDHRRGFRFSTYATLWIRQAIQRGLDNYDLDVRLPAHQAQRARKVNNLEREYSQLHEGEMPSIELIAEMTGFKVEDIMKVKQYSQGSASLDIGVGENGDTSLGSLLPNEEKPIPEQVHETMQSNLISVALRTLPKLEADIIRLSFGVDGADIYTKRAIAQRLGIKERQVEAILSNALNFLSPVAQKIGISPTQAIEP